MGCKQCQKKVSDADRIVCRGYCGASFHMICVKVDVPLLDVMADYPKNVFWMCDECAKLFSNSHFRRFIKDNDTGTTEFEDTMKTVQSDIAKLTSTVTALTEKIETQPTTDSSWPNLGSKRPRDSSTDPPPKASIPTASRGRKVMASVPVIANDNEPDDLWYLWLSSFPPTVTEDDICAMVKECLSIEDDYPVVAKMLVKKGVDVNTLSSVTFKVGISHDYRDSSLDAENWPKGLAFREFVDFDKKPSVTPSGFSKRRTE